MKTNIEQTCYRSDINAINVLYVSNFYSEVKIIVRALLIV